VDSYRRDFMLWAETLGADDEEADFALAWLDDASIPAELYEALLSCLGEFSPAQAGQVAADIGGEEFRYLLFQRAELLVITALCPACHSVVHEWRSLFVEPKVQ
jgi:hypothetical protein